MTTEPSGWNLLEVCKLLASILTPILVAVIAWRVDRSIKRAEATQWASRRGVDRLIELHKEMAPLMNDIYCFLHQIGHFRELEPPLVIQTKRNLDRLYFVNQYLFDDGFRHNYEEFIKSAFVVNSDVGTVAKLRTSPSNLKAERGGSWKPEWDICFASQLPPGLRAQQGAAYANAMKSFANLLGLRPASTS